MSTFEENIKQCARLRLKTKLDEAMRPFDRFIGRAVGGLGLGVSTKFREQFNELAEKVYNAGVEEEERRAVDMAAQHVFDATHPPE